MRISTERSIITLEADNFDDLADSVAESTEIGNPEVLDNFQIHARERRSQDEPDRVILVSVYDDGRVSCRIDGDPGWVRGKHAALEPLIRDTRPFKREFWYGPSWSFASWGVSFASLATPITMWLTTGSTKAELVVSIAAWVTGGFMGLIVGRTVSRARKAEFWIRRDELPERYWKFTANETLAAVIAILTLVATIIFGVVTHNDAKKDSKSSPPAAYLNHFSIF
ncbi:hypothetical protein ACFZCP_24260 [Streptomyces sp. NPDC007971]|uniref:hypothetical protein n=1 Tax=Streptomyces sp. NPDC007971 TaxID=3364799 RepID=UPI0036E8190F